MKQINNDAAATTIEVEPMSQDEADKLILKNKTYRHVQGNFNYRVNQARIIRACNFFIRFVGTVSTVLAQTAYINGNSYTMNSFKIKINLPRVVENLQECKDGGFLLRARSPFIKADKQVFVIIGIAFAVAAVALLCYWLYMERPYYEKLIANKDELILWISCIRLWPVI